MEAIFQDLKKKVKDFLSQDSGGHDYWHAERVFASALHIQQHEGGDRLIIGCAALVHDICRPWEKQTGKSHFGPEALGIIEQELKAINGLSDEQIEKILHIIALHDIYDWDDPIEKNIELKVVQDADNLDAIGALGIARTFAFGGSHHLTIYEPGENHDFSESFKETPGKYTSTVAHFYEKLLKLKDNFNTAFAKKLARERHNFMESFLQQFYAEWNGEK